MRKLNRDLRLSAYFSSTNPSSVRDAARSYIISMRASMAYQPRYIESMEFSCALLAAFAEEHDWPPVGAVSAVHIEEYLASMRTRPRWFGRNDPNDRPPSVSHAETQYRRLKTFFEWLVKRGHIDANPFDLVARPRPPVRVIPTEQHKGLDQIAQRRGLWLVTRLESNTAESLATPSMVRKSNGASPKDLLFENNRF